jgi:hypothetical protein
LGGKYEILPATLFSVHSGWLAQTIDAECLSAQFAFFVGAFSTV